MYLFVITQKIKNEKKLSEEIYDTIISSETNLMRCKNVKLEDDFLLQLKLIFLERYIANLKAVLHLNDLLEEDISFALPIYDLLRKSFSDSRKYIEYTSIQENCKDEVEFKNKIFHYDAQEMSEIFKDLMTESGGEIPDEIINKIKIVLGENDAAFEVLNKLINKEKISKRENVMIKVKDEEIYKHIYSSFRFLSKYIHINPLSIFLHRDISQNNFLVIQKKIDFGLAFTVEMIKMQFSSFHEVKRIIISQVLGAKVTENTRSGYTSLKSFKF